MAKTIKQYYDEIIASKQAQPDLTTLEPSPETSNNLLSDLNSGSKVALWRLWCWIAAVASHTMELVFEKHQETISETVSSKAWATALFLQKKMLEYQHGDSLVWDGAQFVYDPIDETKQIVERAAVVESVNGQLQFKAAAISAGVVVKLTGPQITGLESYMNDMTYPGTQFVVISDDPDDVKVEMEIVYNPAVIASDGSLVSDAASFPVIDAINSFLTDLPFNGVLNLTKLTDSIQLIPGIDDPVLVSAFSKYGTLAYSEIDKQIVPFSGHAILDEINSSFTYIDKNDI